jgi:phosphatidylserine decarboxylase
MTIHKEGRDTLLFVPTILLIINILIYFWVCDWVTALTFSIPASVLLFLFFLQFFRFPNKIPVINENQIICPADGEVVVIEETVENEYFKDKRIQISVFMSPFNVHINWFPINGLVKYYRYHPGRFLVAWLPKSSTENERTTVVIEHPKHGEILVRQIAGAVARRIITYPREGSMAEQGKQLGFIKFGSRVDVYLPLGTKINVKLDQKVKGKQTVLAEF